MKKEEIPNLKESKINEKNVKKWIQAIGNKLENEFTQLDKNPNKNQSSFMGGHLKHKNYMPIYNCPKDFFPEISKISKTNKLEKIKTKIKNIKKYNKHYKKRYLNIINSRIKQINYKPPEEWLVPEEEIKDIENIYLGISLKSNFKNREEYKNKINTEKIKKLLEEYNNKELKFIIKTLSILNYTFCSPHSRLIKTILIHKNELKIDSIIRTKNIPKHIKNDYNTIITKTNPYITGSIIATLETIDLYENPKKLYKNFTHSTMSVGCSLEARKLGFQETGIIIINKKDINYKFLKNNIPENQLSKRNVKNHKELYEELENIESIFIHEFAHLIFERIKIPPKIKKEWQENHKDQNNHLKENLTEFFSYTFEMWINNPQKLKNKSKIFYNYYENNFTTSP